MVVASGVMAVAVLAGCGGGQAPGGDGPAALASAASPSPSPTPVWPNPALTVVTVPQSTGTPVTEWDREVARSFAEQYGDEEQHLAIYQHQDDWQVFWDQLPQRFGDIYAGSSFTGSDGELAWVGVTGEVPDALVALAEQLPIAVELRGGALMTESEREWVQNAGMEAFEADVQPAGGWGGGLDAPSATFRIDYVPDGAPKRADDATTAAVVAAAREALGRDVPFTVEYFPDDRDPLTTEPAVWFLPAGWVPDPAATSVEVLVYEQGCTSGEGAAGNTAPPAVEVTRDEVRIAVSTYLRRGRRPAPTTRRLHCSSTSGSRSGTARWSTCTGTSTTASARA